MSCVTLGFTCRTMGLRFPLRHGGGGYRNTEPSGVVRKQGRERHVSWGAVGFLGKTVDTMPGYAGVATFLLDVALCNKHPGQTGVTAEPDVGLLIRLSAGNPYYQHRPASPLYTNRQASAAQVSAVFTHLKACRCCSYIYHKYTAARLCLYL